ncbi:MAG: hypothetical protein KIS85_04145 [Anaerolineales bacterium]|nr:hypothetical protein [Anaerolineales bacterium]
MFKQRRSLLVVSILLAILVSACGGAGASTQSQDLAATQQALEATQQAIEQQQQQQQPQRGQPQREQPEEEEDEDIDPGRGPGQEASLEGEPYYVEEFSEAPQSWSYFLLSGDERDFDLYTRSDRLVFDITGDYVWAYMTYDSYYYTDVRVDFRAENLGNNNNNVSLICRYNERGWYEFNVSNNGLYWIYRYTISNDTFHQLYNGGVSNLRTGKDTNTYTVICDGNRLTLGVNGVEVRTVQDNMFDEGLVGIGVSSFDLTPVLVEVDYVEISQP